MPVLEGGLTAPTLPELVAVICPECDGETECDRCGSLGYVEVCGGCLEVPDPATDCCSCNRVDPEVLWALSVGWLSPAQVGL